MDRTKLDLKSARNYWPIIIINAVLIAFVILRGFLCMSIMDEVFNIGQSFRAVQGNVYLVENWDYFQTGDSFSTPFLYLFYKLTGSTEGIVLYSRLVFIVIQVLLAVFLYKILSRFFDRVHSFFAVAVYITALALLNYNMWYDNWEAFFRMIGIFLIFCVIASGEKLSHKKAYLLIFIAGMAHACMVYAYPTMVIVYVLVLGLILFYKRKDAPKVRNMCAIFYVLGAFSVFLVFLIYVMKIGVKNLFIFNSVMSDAGLASTGRADQFSMSDILNRTKLLFVENFKLYMFPLVIYAVDILLFVLLRKNKRRTLVFCSMMIIGCLVHLMNSVFRSDSLTSLMMYLTLYIVPLYLLVRDNAEKKQLYKDLIVILLVTSYVSGLVYSYTALNGAVKFYAGGRAGVILFVLLMGEALKQTELRFDHKVVFSIFTTLIIGMNVFGLYSHSFDGNRPLDCTTRFKSGVFKGIYECEESVECYETAEATLKKIITDEDKTITCGPYAMQFYFMTGLKPNAINLWDPNNTDYLFEYYKIYYGEPDIIVLNYRLDVYTNPDFIDFVNENYQLVDYTDSFTFYRKSNV